MLKRWAHLISKVWYLKKSLAYKFIVQFQSIPAHMSCFSVIMGWREKQDTSIFMNNRHTEIELLVKCRISNINNKVSVCLDEQNPTHPALYLCAGKSCFNQRFANVIWFCCTFAKHICFLLLWNILVYYLPDDLFPNV